MKILKLNTSLFSRKNFGYELKGAEKLAVDTRQFPVELVNKQLVLEIYLKVDKDLDANTIISGIQDISGVISLENVN